MKKFRSLLHYYFQAVLFYQAVVIKAIIQFQEIILNKEVETKAEALVVRVPVATNKVAANKVAVSKVEKAKAAKAKAEKAEANKAVAKEAANKEAVKFLLVANLLTKNSFLIHLATQITQQLKVRLTRTTKMLMLHFSKMENLS